MSWRDEAACVGELDAFYSNKPGDLALAASLCASCPVLEACEADRATFEVSKREIFGFRAGRGARQRTQEYAATTLPYAPSVLRTMRAVKVLTEAGLSAREIGERLEIAPRNVVRHRERLRNVDNEQLLLVS